MMPFLLKILNFQLEISVNSMFLVTEKPISTSIITAFILNEISEKACPKLKLQNGSKEGSQTDKERVQYSHVLSNRHYTSVGTLV